MASESKNTAPDLCCLQDAKNMTLLVTALALIIAEGKTADEINLLANLYNGVSAQLGIIASYNCVGNSTKSSVQNASSYS